MNLVSFLWGWFSFSGQPDQKNSLLNDFVSYIVGNASFSELSDEEFIPRVDMDDENEGENDRHLAGKKYWIGGYWNPKEAKTDFWIKNYYLLWLQSLSEEFNKKHEKSVVVLGKKQTEFKKEKGSGDEDSRKKNYGANDTKIGLEIDNSTRRYISLVVKMVTWKVEVRGDIVEAYDFKLNTNQKFKKRIYHEHINIVGLSKNFEEFYGGGWRVANYDTQIKWVVPLKHSSFDIQPTHLEWLHFLEVNKRKVLNFGIHLKNNHSFSLLKINLIGIDIDYFFLSNTYHIPTERNGGNYELGNYFFLKIYCDHTDNQERKDGKWTLEN